MSYWKKVIPVLEHDDVSSILAESCPFYSLLTILIHNMAEYW